MLPIKLLTTAALFFYLSGPAYAQPDVPGFCEIGVIGGGGKYDRTGMPIKYDFKIPSAAAAGVFVRKQVQPSLSLEADLLFEHKTLGQDIIYVDSMGRHIANGSLQTTYNYITLPVLARFSTGLKPGLHTFLGAYTSYWTGSRSIARIGKDKHTEKLNFTNDTVRLDAGLVFGLGSKIPIKEKFFLTLEFRDQLGLTNTVKNSPRGRPIKNNTVYFLTGISYKLKPGRTFPCVSW